MREYVYKHRVKPLIALRTNILRGLKLQQPEKFENHILGGDLNVVITEKPCLL